MVRKKNHMDIPIDDIDNLPSDDELEAMEPLQGTGMTAQEFGKRYLFKGTKLKSRTEIGYDSKGNRWEMYEAERSCWLWIKYNSKVEFLEESDEPFKTMEDCESDAKQHGMDRQFFTMM